MLAINTPDPPDDSSWIFSWLDGVLEPEAELPETVAVVGGTAGV